MMRTAAVLAQLALAAGTAVPPQLLHPPLPTGPRAPHVTPMAPKPYWSWDTIPTSMHGADKSRLYNDSEVARLAKYQMVTPEKWYTTCASQGPTQGGPECAIEGKTEHLFSRIRAINPKVTTILYWNSMFDFSFYTAHQRMLDLEAAGTHAFLRDEKGEVIYLCNDGNVYCNITTFDWTQPAVRELWVDTVMNATQAGEGRADGIFADHSGTYGNGINIGTSRNGQTGDQLCNGKGRGRLCYNFTTEFTDSFNSWHDWATNYTQDLLSKSTGGPVIQGPFARMGAADACSFDSIIAEQTQGKVLSSGVTMHLTVNEAKGGGSCKPSPSCIAAYLAAAEPFTYLHCMGNGDDLLGQTTFPEMDYKLGAPHGPAIEIPSKGSGVWKRTFGDKDDGPYVIWDNNHNNGTYHFPGEPPPPPEHHHLPPHPPSPPYPPTPPGPPPVVPQTCGVTKANTGVGQHELSGLTVTTSAAACCALCDQREGCVTWAWHTEQKGACHLHTTGAYFHEKSGRGDPYPDATRGT